MNMAHECKMKVNQKLVWLALIFLIGLNACFAQSFADANWSVEWDAFETLPPTAGQADALGVAGPFVGVHNDALIIAGGANFAKPHWESAKKWHSDIWVLEKNGADYTWYTGFNLDRPMGYGMAVSTPHGVLCMGGEDGSRCYADVFLLKWDRVNKTIVTETLPSLPKPCAFGAAALLGDTVYVAGGTQDTSLKSAMNNFWSLDMAQKSNPDRWVWEELPPWPGQPRAFNLTIAQHDGKEHCIYVISGRTQIGEQSSDIEFLSDVYKFSPQTYRRLIREGKALQDVWQACTPAPYSVCAAPGVAVGQSHIFVFGGADGSLFHKADILKDDHPGFPRRLSAYHTITDTWIQADQLPVSAVTTIAVMWDGKFVIATGELRPRVRTPDIWQGQLVRAGHSFGVLNFTLLGGYLLAMVGIGFYFSKRNKSTDDYFRGGQRLPGWAAGLSIFATMLSSITFIAIPAQVFATDWTFYTVNMMAIVVAPFIIFFILPFFRRIDATSAYEYLEKRFNAPARFFAAASYTLFQLGRMAIVMFLPALALTTITPFSVQQCILIIGVLSIIYCTMGGLEAVVWTDAIQAIILLGGAFLTLLLIFFSTVGSFEDLYQIVNAKQKLHLINWDFSASSYMTTAFWVMVIGGIGQSLVPYASDQGIVQRYLSTKDIKSARNSILTNAFVTLPASLLFFGVGTALFVFYSLNPHKLSPGLQNDAIFPLYIANELPIGVSGLIVAGVFAAAQSTVSTSMNSVSTVLVTDFVRRFSLLKTESGYLRLARLLTFLSGAAGTTLALLFAGADITSLWEQFMSVLGLFGGSMCGLFLLGIFTKRTGGIAALCGAVISAFALYWVKTYTDVTFLLYAAIGIVVCVVSGYVLSFVFREKQKDITGLTIHTA